MQVSLVDAGLSRSLSRALSFPPPPSLSFLRARSLALSRALSLSASLFLFLSLSLFLCLSVSRSLAPSLSCAHARARSLSLYTHKSTRDNVHKVSYRTNRVLLIHVSTLLDELLNLFDLHFTHRKKERVLAAVIAQQRLHFFMAEVERSYAILQGAGVSEQVTRAHTERHNALHAYSRTPKRTRTRGVCVCAHAGV